METKSLKTKLILYSVIIAVNVIPWSLMVLNHWMITGIVSVNLFILSLMTLPDNKLDRPLVAVFVTRLNMLLVLIVSGMFILYN